MQTSEGAEERAIASGDADMTSSTVRCFFSLTKDVSGECMFVFLEFLYACFVLIPCV